jgi:hypothetical protein
LIDIHDSLIFGHFSITHIKYIYNLQIFAFELLMSKLFDCRRMFLRSKCTSHILCKLGSCPAFRFFGQPAKSDESHPPNLVVIPTTAVL